ncbi:MAG: S41 family peptidase, partial [bacterium]
MKWKTRLLFSSGFIFIIFATMIVLKSPFREVIAQENNVQSKLQLFGTLLETLQRNYVEERTTEELLESAINGMLANLDPHTVYLPVDNFKRWNQNFEGYSGIGILFDIIGKYPMITGFVDGSPAAKADLHVGDVILKINNQSTQGLAKDEVIDYISGHSFPKIRLKVFDRTLEKTKTVLLERAHLNLNSIEGAYMISSHTGYIALERFNSTTATELDEALESLLAHGMEFLVLDLRDNGGGYLSAAVEVTDRFLPSGKLMVYTKGRHSRSYQEYYSTRTTKYETLPLIILLNHGTASAAEIVAGALQDWDRALIVGTTSFGKGLVQSQFRFRDGSALLATTARYYTPLGRLIQRDYNNMSKDEYYAGAYHNRAEWLPLP